MKYRLTPVIKQIMSILNNYNLEIIKMEGDHIKINRPKSFEQLRRPIILVNEPPRAKARGINE